MIVITIPIYKTDPTPEELQSLRRCLTILNKYAIYFVTYKELDISVYINEIHFFKRELKVKYFDEVFFESINGYNSLMTSLVFYKSFSEYKYILIYQLDAYVFSDQLEYWCSKDYDYIGAPWLTDYKSYDQGGKLWKVGNGGLSLRKTSSFINILSRKRPVLSYQKLIAYKQSFNLSGVRSFFGITVRLLGYKNTIHYFINKFDQNEDVFWTQYLEQLGLGFNIPQPEEALKFAFENSPSYLYEYNNKLLPFGCHAWQRYEYEDFWKYHIDGL